MTRFCCVCITQKKTDFAGGALLAAAGTEYMPTLLEDESEEAPKKTPSDPMERLLSLFQGESVKPSSTELTTIGALMKDKEGFKLCYQGTEISEGEGAVVVYSLLPDGTLTFFCHNPAPDPEAFQKILPVPEDLELPPETCLIFQPGAATLCLFPHFPETCLRTHRLESDLSFEKGGTISLSYSVEAGGVCVQKCDVEIRVEV